MPIFKNHNVIFVHIPKTGGTSILRMFGLKLEVEDFDIFYHQDEIYEYDHASAIFLKQNIPADYWMEAYKFTIVRNPYERLVSEFFWKKKDKDARTIDVDHLEFKDFVEFLHSNFDDIMQKTHKEKSHFLPQHSFILPEIKVYKMEEIDNLINILADKYGVNKPETKFNQTNHQYFEEYYTTELKKLVYEIYEQDFLVFDYDF